MKIEALALMGGKILLCRSRGFGRHKRLEGTAGNSSKKNKQNKKKMHCRASLR